MDTTPATTVHAAPVSTRQQRRGGVARATSVAVAVLLLMGLLPPPDAAAAKPSDPPAGSATSPKLPPGRENKHEPTPTVPPAPVVTASPVPKVAPPAEDPPASTFVAPEPTPEPVTTAPTSRPASTGGAAPGGNLAAPAGSAAPPTLPPGVEPTTDPLLEAPDHAAGLGVDPGDPSRPLGGSTSSLPVALAGGALVAAVCGFILVATSRRRTDGAEPVDRAVDLRQAEPAPEPDPEQRLAEALAATTTRRTPPAKGSSVPLWVQRLNPEPPVMPAAPLESDPLEAGHRSLADGPMRVGRLAAPEPGFEEPD